MKKIVVFLKNKCNGIRNRLINMKLVETKKINHFSKNNKTVYIIRRFPGAGFFSNYFYVISHLVYAKQHNYLSVIDFETYKTLYTENHKIFGSNNSWEYYFLQPNNIKLKDIKKYRVNIFSENKMKFGLAPCYLDDSCAYPSKEIVKDLNETILKNINFNFNIKKMLEKDSLNIDYNDCIGIHIRGTDMKYDPTHPNPYSIGTVIDYIKKNKINKNYKYILLCTDEKKYVEDMKKEFGNQIVTFDAFRMDENSTIGVHKTINKRENHKFLLGYEVIRDAYNLSKCKSFICGKSNVSFASILWNNNKYEKLYFWDENKFVIR